MMVTQAEAMLDLLALQGGLKDHRCLMFPVTHNNLSGEAISSYPTGLRSAWHRRYLGSWLPCWTSGATTPTRALQRQKLKSQTRSQARHFLLVAGSYIPSDPSALWDQLFLQHPVR